MQPQVQPANEGVIDLDVRIRDDAAAIAPYADLPWRVALTNPGRKPPWGFSGVNHPYLGSAPQNADPAADAAAALSRLDADGIRLGVLLPGGLLDLSALPTADYASACARAYNRWLVEQWLENPRLHGAVLLAPQDPPGAASELRSAVTSGGTRIAAGLVPLTGLDPLLGHRRYDAIYEAATECGVPLFLHAGGALMLPGSPHLPTQFSNQFEQLAMSRPLLAMAHLVNMVGTGVLVRYPDLTFVFLGAGVSWLVHCVLRMDKEYNENRRDVPYYTERVSMAITSRVRVGTQPWLSSDSVDVLGQVRASVGLENVVFASGWGGPMPDSATAVGAAFTEAGERSAVLGGNALKLLPMQAPAGP